MSTLPARCAALLLVEETDICKSTLSCPPGVVERLRGSGCASGSSLPPHFVRIVREMFGVVKRQYLQVLEQHPSLPLSLEGLIRETEGAGGATSSGGPTPGPVDVLLARCDSTPFTPLFRSLPALLTGSTDTAWVADRLRLIVYERCANDVSAVTPGSASGLPSLGPTRFTQVSSPRRPTSVSPTRGSPAVSPTLPELDVRDQLFGVRRRQLGPVDGAGAAGAHALHALRAHALAASRGELTLAPYTFVLSRRGLAQLTQAHGSHGGASTGAESLLPGALQHLSP